MRELEGKESAPPAVFENKLAAIEDAQEQLEVKLNQQ